MQLGLNGSTVTTTSPTSLSDNTTYIGGEISNFARRFNGNISDTIIYNTALSSTARSLIEQYQSAKWDVALTAPGTGAAEAAAAMNATTGYNVFTTRYLERLSQYADVSLQATNNITLDLKADTLALANDRSLTLTAGNAITTASTGTIQTRGTGGITFNAPDIYLAHQLDLVTGGGNITLNGATTLGTSQSFNAGTGIITVNAVNAGANNLTLTADDLALNDTWGQSARLGVVTLNSVNAVSLPSISASFVFVRTTGAGSDIALNGVLNASGAGDAITLVSGRNFINNAGANALVTPNGRALVYSASPSANAMGGIAGYAKRYNTAYGDAIPAGTADLFLYTVNPTLIITADNASRIYGDANPAFGYTATGFIDGDGASVLSGDADYNTLAAPASNAGTYGITTTRGDILNPYNYTLSYTDGTLTVTPRSITVTSDAASKTYGDANPGFTYTVGGGGLVNGDTLSGALASAAIAASDIGLYAITQGTLAAGSNYTLTGFTGGALTVTPRRITVTAHNQYRILGQPNPNLTYSVAGLANGNGISGSLRTSATVNSTLGTYAITLGSLITSANYVISFIPGSLTISPLTTQVTTAEIGRTNSIEVPSLHTSHPVMMGTGSENKSLLYSVDIPESTLNTYNSIESASGPDTKSADLFLSRFYKTHFTKELLLQLGYDVP